MTRITGEREVECPSCGARQLEASSLLGTVCRACGESFPVVPLPESRAWFSMGNWVAAAGWMAREVWAETARRWRKPKSSLGRLRPGGVLAASRELQDVRLPNGGPAAEGGLAPEGHRNVSCPYCQAGAILPESALTHACKFCGRHFPLRDHHISDEVQANIVTAGKVVIHHRGLLVATSLRCGELIVYGRTEGALTVSGCAEYYDQGETIGQLHCGHLVINRGARRTFHQRVFAMEGEIHGELTGDICCQGRLHIWPGAAVHGSVLAGQVVLDAGGQLNGSMGTLTAVLDPGARLTDTARELRHHFSQETAG